MIPIPYPPGLPSSPPVSSLSFSQVSLLFFPASFSFGSSQSLPRLCSIRGSSGIAATQSERARSHPQRQYGGCNAKRAGVGHIRSDSMVCRQPNALQILCYSSPPPPPPSSSPSTSTTTTTTRSLALPPPFLPPS